MGNKQNIETVNHWSDLVNLANELNESDDNDPGTAILEKLDFIINLIQQQDKQIIKSLNKKPRVKYKNIIFVKFLVKNNRIGMF